MKILKRPIIAERKMIAHIEELGKLVFDENYTFTMEDYAKIQTSKSYKNEYAKNEEECKSYMSENAIARKTMFDYLFDLSETLFDKYMKKNHAESLDIEEEEIANYDIETTANETNSLNAINNVHGFNGVDRICRTDLQHDQRYIDFYKEATKVVKYEDEEKKERVCHRYAFQQLDVILQELNERILEAEHETVLLYSYERGRKWKNEK